MSVTLREITRENWRDALALTVEPDQMRFISEVDPPAALALAKAFVRPGGLPTTPYGIYAGESMVGLFNLVFEPASRDNYWIFHFFIDQQFQRRGLGIRALSALRDLLKREHPVCESLALTVHPENVAARQLYSRFGFEPTGEIAFGEPMFRLSVGASSRGAE